MQQRFADKHKKLFQVDLGHNKLMTKKGTIEYANFLTRLIMHLPNQAISSSRRGGPMLSF
jgi:hypothetical protein